VQERNECNRQVIEAFRANAGKVGGSGPSQLLLLTTTGAKSGKRHTTPVGYLEENGRVYVFASKGGAPVSPDWYHNLVANPTVTVELGPDKFEAKAAPVKGEERDRIYARQAQRAPVFADYQTRTTRQIPVVELQKTS